MDFELSQLRHKQNENKTAVVTFIDIRNINMFIKTI